MGGETQARRDPRRGGNKPGACRAVRSGKTVTSGRLCRLLMSATRVVTGAGVESEQDPLEQSGVYGGVRTSEMRRFACHHVSRKNYERGEILTSASKKIDLKSDKICQANTCTCCLGAAAIFLRSVNNRVLVQLLALQCAFPDIHPLWPNRIFTLNIRSYPQRPRGTGVPLTSPGACRKARVDGSA